MLWIVATPLGNPGDLSPRARCVLEEADLVLAEDTRRAGLLCQRCGVLPRHFMSFHNHNEDTRVRQVLNELATGKRLALISDAGMPLIADPGYRLVQACRKAHIPVSVVPGPSAPLTALAGSGIAPQPFVFLGFLPRNRGEQEKTLVPFASLALTLIFLERRDRLTETLTTAYAILGERDICIARELTKTHESFLCGRLLADGRIRDMSEQILSVHDLLGEITVVVGPPQTGTASDRETVLALIEEERRAGGSPRDVARRVQLQVKGWTVKAIYTMMSSGRRA